MIETFSILPYIFAKSDDEDFEIRDDLIDWMDNYARIYQPNHRSNINGYQSPDDFYKEESFAPFLNYMSERIFSLLDKIKTNEEADISFTPRLSNMWFNINYKGCYNICHTHPGSQLAGILYVNTPDDSGDITFMHHDYHNLSLIQKSTRDFEPDDGDMVIFPASLQHSVGMNTQDEPRFSIAFNLYEYYD